MKTIPSFPSHALPVTTLLLMMVVGTATSGQAQTVAGRLQTQIITGTGSGGQDQLQVSVELAAAPTFAVGSATLMFTFNDEALAIASSPAANDALVAGSDYRFEDPFVGDTGNDKHYGPSTVTLFDEASRLSVNLVLEVTGSGQPLSETFATVVTLFFDITEPASNPNVSWILPTSGDANPTEVFLEDNRTPVAVGTFSVESPTPEATLIVNSTADPGDGTCDEAECTLREAMEAANAADERQVIHFDIPGDGVHTITLASALPNLTVPVIIDGYTQPGARPNTLPVGNDAILLIEIDGTDSVTPLISLRGGESTVRGLIIARARSYGILLGGSDNLIEGNFIGTDPTGTVNRGNGVIGILTTNAFGGMAGTVIGGKDPAARNLISGNGRNGGISIGGNPAFSPSAGITIQGNYIGTDASGLVALGNDLIGINVAHGRNILIGGAEPGAGNVIAANGGQGVNLRNSTTSSTVVQNITVQGNLIGVGADTSALGNGGRGIDLFLRGGHTIGGSGENAGNVIAHNGGAGIRARGSSDVFIAGNSIQANAEAGVFVRGSSGVHISANAFSANGGLGIDLDCAGDSGDGTTANDPGDADEGPNNCQNTPEIAAVRLVDVGDLDLVDLHVEYFVDTDTANAAYPLTIEFFAAGVEGEGERYLGSDVYAGTDWASGDTAAGFRVADLGNARALGISSGDVLAATATDANGNTSEFMASSAKVPLAAPVISAPADGAQNVPVPLEVTWSMVSGAASYQVQVSQDPEFDRPAVDTSDVVEERLMVHELAHSAEYYCRVRAVEAGGAGPWSSVSRFTTAAAVSSEAERLPKRFSLDQNYPNPFNPATRLTFALPQATHVHLAVFDALGRKVAVLVDAQLGAGVHDVTFEAGDLPAGVYVYLFESELHRDARKMVLLK